MSQVVVRRSMRRVVIAATVVFTGACGQGAGNLQGSAPAAKLYSGERLRVGSRPNEVSVGDFNGDGFVDLVTANTGSNDVSVLLGAGGGNFGPVRHFRVGDGPVSVATADLNEDGRSDIVTANRDSDTITVLLGEDDGGFRNGGSFASGSAPGSVAVADFDGDGRVDVVASSAGSEVTVFDGTGDGTLGVGRSFVAGPGADPISVADLNGDGHMDIVAFPYGAVAVLFGTGDGGFATAHEFPAGTLWGTLGIADLNGDEQLDVVTVQEEGRKMSVLLGVGNGALGPPRTYDVGGDCANSVALGDLNGDGYADVVTANYDDGYNNDISVLVGTGNGEFASPTTFAVGGSAQGVRVVDLDGDGRSDVVTVDSLFDEVTVLFGAGDGRLKVVDEYPAGAANAEFGNSIVVGDFDGNGFPDVATSSFATSSFSAGGSVHLALASGDGSLSAPGTFDVSGSPVSLATGDLDGNASLDLVLAIARADDRGRCETADIEVLLGTGDGAFAAPSKFPIGVGCPGSLAVADLNGDDYLDVLVANGTAETVSVLLGGGGGSLGVPQRFQVRATPQALAVADFNGDGHLDVATANGESKSVSVLLGFGDGHLALHEIHQMSGSPVAISVVDIDDDGSVDVVTANGEAHSVSVLRGLGGGGLAAPVDFMVRRNPISVAVQDVDGDGIPDVVTANAGFRSRVSVLPGTPTGDLGPARYFVISNGSGADGPNDALAVALTDVNADGSVDIVTANRDPSEDKASVSVLLHE